MSVGRPLRQLPYLRRLPLTSQVLNRLSVTGVSHSFCSSRSRRFASCTFDGTPLTLTSCSKVSLNDGHIYIPVSFPSCEVFSFLGALAKLMVGRAYCQALPAKPINPLKFISTVNKIIIDTSVEGRRVHDFELLGAAGLLLLGWRRIPHGSPAQCVEEVHRLSHAVAVLLLHSK